MNLLRLQAELDRLAGGLKVCRVRVALPKALASLAPTQAWGLRRRQWSGGQLPCVASPQTLV